MDSSEFIIKNSIKDHPLEKQKTLYGLFATLAYLQYLKVI